MKHISEYVLKDSLKQLQDIFIELQVKRIFLVTGRTSFKTTGAEAILSKYIDQYDVLRYFDFSSNPKIEDIIKGRRIFEKFIPDIIVAIGGGSVIDTAKAISCLPANKNTALSILKSEIPTPSRQSKLIIAPTTSGSGSECTHFSVIYIGKTKYSLTHKTLIPDYIFLDPSLTYSASPYLTAVTGLDAFTQAIEAFWSVKATDESRSYSKEALRSIMDVFPNIVNNPTSESRKKMMWGAHLAGKAINIAQTTASHAMSYIITSKYNIAHGHAVALTIPQLIRYNFSYAKKNNKGIDSSKMEYISKELCKLLSCDNIVQLESRVKSIIKKTGVEMKLSKLGAKNRDEIDEIVNGVNIERLNNNPKFLNKTDIKEIISAIW